jgi:hypothetical protein
MRFAYFALILLLLTTAVRAQRIAPSDYYRALTPTQRAALDAQGSGERLHWYAAVEGFSRTDQSQLSRSIGGLLATSPGQRFDFGLLAGVTFRQRWAAEIGYADAPLHNRLTINSSPQPIHYTYATAGHTLVLRAKRRLVAGGRGESGLWVSAAVGLLANGGTVEEGFRLKALYYARSRVTPDTLALNGDPAPGIRPLPLVEVGLEYALRIGNRLGLGLYARRIWGTGTALSTDVRYYVNSTETQRATLTANGDGWAVGLALRYVYARQFGGRRRILEE